MDAKGMQPSQAQNPEVPHFLLSHCPACILQAGSLFSTAPLTSSACPPSSPPPPLLLQPPLICLPLQLLLAPQQVLIQQGVG